MAGPRQNGHSGRVSGAAERPIAEDASPDVVRLRRGFLARLRPVGYVHFLQWFGFVVAVASAPAVFTSTLYSTRDRVLLSLLIAALLVARLGFASDWVEATTSGLAWRTGFIIRRYSWERITTLRAEQATLLTPPTSISASALIVECPDFVDRRKTIHASVLAGDERITEFVRAAEALRAASRSEAGQTRSVQ